MAPRPWEVRGGVSLHQLQNDRLSNNNARLNGSPFQARRLKEQVVQRQAGFATVPETGRGSSLLRRPAARIGELGGVVPPLDWPPAFETGPENRHGDGAGASRSRRSRVERARQ
jgi:hypothetical protein